MSVKNNSILFLLFIVLLCCTSAVSAVSNDTIDNVVSEVDSSDEFISVSVDDQVEDMDETVLSAQDEYDNLTVNNDDEVLSIDSNDDSLGVTTSETNNYLNDIKASTSDEYYKFVNYLIKQKRFKFNAKSSDDGYSIYSTSKYQSKLFDGENYVLPAKNSYFLSKNRIGYVVMGEYYPDVLYSQNNNIYLDELYLGWLKNVENYHFSLTIENSNGNIVQIGDSSNGFVNAVVNGASVNGNTINSPQDNSNLPPVFDLRNVSGQNYVTPVKNQGKEYANCWAFASIAAIESYLLKTEDKSYDLSSYDFSENNMKNVMSSIGKQGADYLVNNGGVDNMVLAYLLRWSGPILEEFDKYNLTNMNNIPLEFANVAKHVQGIKYIHARNNETDNNEIKQAVYDYGAVVTSMYWAKSNKYEHNDNYYYYETTTARMWHEVCIIGWDDNYPKENFSKTAPDNGAFLIKNSYGEEDDEYGYYWVSYYDTTLAKRTSPELLYKYAGFSFTLIENNTNYGKNYNYNPLGVTFWDKNQNTNSYYSSWVADDEEILKACGVYVHDACNCTIEVFINNKINNGATTVVPLFYGGFHTITFKNPVNVKKGQNFMIVVTINSNSNIQIPVECNYNIYSSVEDSHMSGLIYKNGYSYTPSTFSNADVCLNVYTEYKKFSGAKLETVDAEYKNNIFDVKTKLLDANGNAVKNFELICGVEISADNIDYTIAKTNDNGEVTLSFKNGVKINNEKISVSFTIYDACRSLILVKSVEIINIPKFTANSASSINVGGCNKIGSVAVGGNIDSIKVSSCGKIDSIFVGGNIGSIIVEECGKIGNIIVGCNIGSIIVRGCGEIGSIVVGNTINSLIVDNCGDISNIISNNISSIDIRSCGEITSINVGSLTSAGSLIVSGCGEIHSIYIVEDIGTIIVKGCGEIGSIIVGRNTGAINIDNCGEIGSIIVGGNTGLVTVNRCGEIKSLTVGGTTEDICIRNCGKIINQAIGVGNTIIRPDINVIFKNKEDKYIISI